MSEYLKIVTDGVEGADLLKNEHANTKLQRLFNLIRKNNIFSKARNICPIRFGEAAYSKVDLYTPTITASTAFALNFDIEDFASADIYIRRHATFPNAFVGGTTGRYEVSAYWETTFNDDAANYAVSSLKLDLYKNGVFYKPLDIKPMKVVLDVSTNYYFPFMSLQGTRPIKLTNQDYFDIRLTHDGSASFGANVSHGGYMSVKFLSKG